LPRLVASSGAAIGVMDLRAMAVVGAAARPLQVKHTQGGEGDRSVRITVETVVKADSNAVWRAWNDPEDIEQWNAASDDCTRLERRRLA
jgi:hypothetical protein